MAEAPARLAAHDRDQLVEDLLRSLGLLVHRRCDCWRCARALQLLERARALGYRLGGA